MATDPFAWTLLELCGALNDLTYYVVGGIGDLPHNIWNIFVATLGQPQWGLAPGDFTFHLGLAEWIFIDNRSVMVPFIGATLILMFTMINVLMFIWVERKMLARFMDRRGPMVSGPFGLLQNVWDGMKLLIKENAKPARADLLAFFLCPIILVGSAFAAIAVIPLSSKAQLASIDLDVLYVVMLFAFAPYAIFLGGWGSYNKFSLIGGMRSAAQMLAGEVPFFLSVGGVILLAGSYRFGDIVAWQETHGWMIFAQPLGAVLFVVAVLIELERIPFDLPEAESELVEGWTTEYSGLRWGMLWLGGYMRGFVGCAMITLFFLGGWTMPTYTVGGVMVFTPHIVTPVAVFMAKTYLVFAVFVWIRAAYPRLRTDQLLSAGWKRLLPLTLINILIVGLLIVDNQKPGEVVQTPFGPLLYDTALAWGVGGATFFTMVALYSMRYTPRVLAPLYVTARMFLSTMGWLGGQPITVLYPYERLEIPDSARWLHGLSDERCISCARCCRICPDNCLNMVETQHGRHPDPRFTTRPALDANHCMFCGLCVEVCPTGALTMGPNFELSGWARDELYWSQDELMGYVEHDYQENPHKGEIEVENWIDKLVYPLITPVLQFLTPRNYEHAKGTNEDAYEIPSVFRQLSGDTQDRKELGMMVQAMSPRSKKALKMLMDDKKKKTEGPLDFSAWDYRHARRKEGKGSGYGEMAPGQEDKGAA